MKTTYKRYKRELALLIILAIVITMVGCKKKKAGSESDPSIPSSETETTPEETTTETTEATTTTESSTSSETSETTPSEVTESSEPSETTLDLTATPTDVPVDPTATTAPTNKPADPTATSTPKPTKAPKETKKADPTPTTPPTDTPTSTSTPTPVPTDTPTPTPTTAPAVSLPKPNLSKDTAISAMKDAVRDYCSGHTITYTNDAGEEKTVNFQFHDSVMSNAQKRAEYSAANNEIGHLDISGTWNGMEACGGMGCYPIYNGGDPYWVYTWTDHSGTNHEYDNLYDAAYSFAKFLITEHSKKLTSQTERIFYGVGISYRTSSDYSNMWSINYGISDVKNYAFSIYICGDGIGDATNHGYYTN